MANKRKKIKVFLFVLIGILTISVGYASISAINLLINGNGTVSVNQNNFIVHFTEAKEITGTTGVSGTSSIDTQDDTKAMFDVTGLTKVGDYAEAVYTVRNDSNGVGAEISLSVSNSNSEYFKVTETILDNKLQAGDETTASVKVEMIKTPINDSVTTSVTAKLIATPLENANAIGGDRNSKATDDPVSFATDSWRTIQTAVRNNNTSVYNVGDTKTVTINGTDYRVRIANKTTGDHCGDNDIAYSQTACGFVVEFAEIVEKRSMHFSTNKVIGGWPGTKLYEYLQGTFYENLPDELKSVIATTRVISGYGNNGVDTENLVSNDRLYFLSGFEVFGIDDADTSSSTTTQLEYYQGMVADVTQNGYPSYSRAYKGYNGSSGADEFWWLRSARSYTPAGFNIVSGGRVREIGVDFSSGGVAPAFRIR